MSQDHWHRPIHEGAVNALSKIFIDGFYADKVIYFALKENKKWGSRDRRQFAEAVYEVVRWWRKLWVLSGEEWPDDDQLPGLDRKSLEQILDVWIDGQEGLAQFKTGKGFATDQSIPNWLHELAESQLGEEKWRQTMPELNKPAPVFLRANLARTSVAALVKDLVAEGFQAEAVSAVPGAVRLVERSNVFRSQLFLAGHFEVQDLHSQIVTGWLQAEPGQRVIDACAGAGGKTLSLAGQMNNQGKIIAMDVSDKKLAELQKRARRAGTSMVETRLIESSKTIKRLEAGADRVLLDVPCSGLGVLRRNPDSKWKLKAVEVAELRNTQQEILRSYSRMAKIGGVLVYATCSILPTENAQQIETFLSQSESAWEFEKDQTLWPQSGGGDGFYVARLRRLK